MAADARKPKESGEEKAAQIRVLIAEDNMINMKVALGILRRMGYEQVCCAVHPAACMPGVLVCPEDIIFGAAAFVQLQNQSGGTEICRGCSAGRCSSADFLEY